MTGGNVKVYQSIDHVEFNAGTSAGWRNGLAEALWGTAKENAESCSWEGITSCTGGQLESSFAEKTPVFPVDTKVNMSQQCACATKKV